MLTSLTQLGYVIQGDMSNGNFQLECMLDIICKIQEIYVLLIICETMEVTLRVTKIYK